MLVNCNCKLCCIGNLPGKESHLFSEMLIKETVNAPGRANVKGKNYELLFTISGSFEKDLFLGRSATDEYKEMTNVEEIPDEIVEQLRSKQNPLTDKNLVCAKCEDLFSPVESKFKEIYDRILKSSDNGDQSFDITSEESEYVELFLLLNIWRVGASDKAYWKLDTTESQCLTELMFNTFNGSNHTNILERFKEAKKDYDCLEVVLFFSREMKEDDSQINDNFIFCDNATNPYMLVVNRLLIFVSSKHFDSLSLPDIVNGELTRSDLQKAHQDRHQNLKFIPADKLQNIHYSAFSKNLVSFSKRATNNYLEAYQDFFRMMPSEEHMTTVRETILQYISSDYEYGITEKVLVKNLSVLLYNEAVRMRSN